WRSLTAHIRRRDVLAADHPPLVTRAREKLERRPIWQLPFSFTQHHGKVGSLRHRALRRAAAEPGDRRVPTTDDEARRAGALERGESQLRRSRTPFELQQAMFIARPTGSPRTERRFDVRESPASITQVLVTRVFPERHAVAW